MPGYGQYRRLPFDPRMVQEIQGSPSMRTEQGSNFLSQWGGIQGYTRASGMPVGARVTYYALKDGIPVDDVSDATGLSRQEASEGLSWLKSRGYVGDDNSVRE